MKLRAILPPTALSLCFVCALTQATSFAQQPSQSPEAQSIVQRAVEAELAADRDDHTLWRYNVLEKLEDNSVYEVVDTSQGEVKRKVEQAGKPVSPAEQQAQTAKIQAFLTDAHAQAKQKRDGEHDDKSAEKMLNLLPRAFLWNVSAEDATQVKLHFVPNPAFSPPDIESRVLAAMEGDLIVDRAQHRIATIRGRLSHDVNIGFGLLGKLREGGTFNVERRQLAPNIWQITETHVHIEGRALLFKTIGEQTDEVKTDFQPVSSSTTLAEAAAMLIPR